MPPVLIPLETNGKRPTVKGWASPDYQPPEEFAGNVGLRTDGIVVIDCDSDVAATRWKTLTPQVTLIQVKTRRGQHFYYRLPEGASFRPGPLTEGTDIKTGPGAYVLIPPSVIDDFHYSWAGERFRWDFDPASLPEAPVALIEELLSEVATPAESDGEGWDNIPEGRRNSTLTALAGSLRRQGAGAEAIASTLATMNAHRCSPPLPQDELVAIVRSVLRYESDPDTPNGDIEIIGDDLIEPEVERPNIVWAGDLSVPPPPRWLLFPYLPAGRLILLDGNEGIGKGMFATWVAVSMTAGRFDVPAAPVLWGSTEDDPEEDILRRLLAAGYTPGQHEGIGFLAGEAMTWRYPGDIGKLAQVVRDTGARILVLDPGRSFLGPPNGMSMAEFTYNSEAHVRPGLEALNLLARRLDISVLFIHHWNKNLTASIRVRSGGSAAFAQTVRHRLTLDYMGGEHAIAVEKSNMTSRENTVRGYTLDEVPEFSTARFVMGDTHPAVDLDEWETSQRGEGSLSGEEEVELNAALVADAAQRELEYGAAFWNREQLRARFGVSHRLAREIIDDLTRQSLIQRGSRNQLVWQP